MKHKGSKFPYEDKRNSELINAFRKEMASCSRIVMGDIFKNVVRYPCSRFWVSEERAAIVISAMLNGSGGCVGKCKMAMYSELLARVKRIIKENPHLPLSKAVFFAVNSPAPMFYLSPGQAKSIINSIRFSKSRPL